MKNFQAIASSYKFPKVSSFSGLLLAALVMLFLSQAGISFAHAHYQSSNIVPNSTITSAPAQLTVTFGEETSPTGTKLTVTDSAGKQVDKGDLKINGATVTLSLNSLTDGTYTVTYQTLTEDDGGVVNGNYAFTVATGGTAATGAAKPTEAESGGDDVPSAAPATGFGGTSEPAGTNSFGVVLGLAALSLFAGAGLLAVRRYGKPR